MSRRNATLAAKCGEDKHGKTGHHMAEAKTERGHISLPSFCEFIGVPLDKGYALIHNGQIKAVNVAANPNGRPRWRIAWIEIERFLAARSTQQPQPVRKQRRRRAAATATKEYF